MMEGGWKVVEVGLGDLVRWRTLRSLMRFSSFWCLSSNVDGSRLGKSLSANGKAADMGETSADSAGRRQSKWSSRAGGAAAGGYLEARLEAGVGWRRAWAGGGVGRRRAWAGGGVGWRRAWAGGYQTPS